MGLDGSLSDGCDPSDPGVCIFQGAFWGLMAALVMGVIRLILVFVYRPPEKCGEEDMRPGILKDVHYMYFAMMLSAVATAVAIVVSYATEPPELKYVSRNKHLH